MRGRVTRIWKVLAIIALGAVLALALLNGWYKWLGHALPRHQSRSIRHHHRHDESLPEHLRQIKRLP